MKPTVSSPFEPRATESRALRALLEAANAGRGGATLVVGPLGIGKSYLVDSMVRSADGMTIGYGRASDRVDAPPLYPLWPCLRTLGLAPGSLGTVFDITERILSAAARAERPILWVIEDLQLSETATLEVLCMLAEPLRGLRLALIMTARDDDARAPAHAAGWLARLTRVSTVVRLGPFAAEASLALLKTTAPRLSRGQALRVHRLAQGNPLLLSEYGRAVARGADPASVPVVIAELVREQLKALPKDTLAAVQAGAVLGREFTASSAALLLGWPPARAIEAQTAAVQAGLLVEHELGVHAFSHDVTRDVAQASLSVEALRALHARAADTLRDATAAARVAERAGHLLAAANARSLPSVLAQTKDAIALATSANAPEAAYALAKAARDAEQLLNGRDAPPRELLALAKLARQTGRHDEHAAWCERASAAAERDGDWPCVAEAALVRGETLQPGVVDHTLVRMLEAALAEVSDATLQGRLKARLAAARQPARDPSGPIALAKEALAMPERDAAERAEKLYFAGAAFAVFAPLADRIAVNEELLERATACGQTSRALHARMRLALDACELGELDAMVGHIDALERDATEPDSLWRALLLRSMHGLMLGDFAASDRALVEVERLTAVTDAPALEQTLTIHRTQRLRIMHEDEALRARLPSVLDSAGQMEAMRLIARVVRAGMFAWLEDEDATRTELASFAGATVELSPTLFGMWSEAVAVAGTTAQRQAALRLCGARRSLQQVSGPIAMTYEGPVTRLSGLLHASLGAFAEAETHLEAALAWVRERDLEPWRARIAYELAALAKKRGNDARSASRRDEARSSSVLMPGLAARLSTLPSVAQARPVATRVSVAREGELWRVAVDDDVARVPDSRGMQLLARLVERSGEELHVLTLASDVDGALSDTDAGATLDAEAVDAYRTRLRELGTSSAEQRERRMLERELSRAVGLRGVRRVGSASERARVNVQRRLRDAVHRIGVVAPALGAYFERALRTGTYCCFRP